MSGFGYNILGFGGGGPPPPPPEVDEDFNRVSFLSHFDGANNGVNDAFDDGSADNLTISTAGNVTQGSFSPFARPDGEWAVSFSGEAGDDITGPTSSDFQFGDNSFTVECFIFPTLIDDYNTTINTSGADGAGRWYISYGATSMYWGTYGNGSNGDLTFDHDMTLGDWYHLAYVRNKSDDKGRMYINGVQKGVWDDARTYGDPAHTLKIGKDFFTDRNNNMNGLISNARVVNGTAVYTSNNFTPPTSPLTAITNTKLLALQSNTIIDNSASAHVLTRNGATPVSAFGPFLTDAAYDPAVNGASAYFDGTHTGAILVASPPTFATSTFTYECWVYPIGNGTYKPLLNQGPRDGSSISALYISGNTKLVLQIADSNSANKIIISGSSNDITLDQWNHIVLTHLYTSSTNSTYKIYSNGILKSTLNHTGGFNWSTGAGSNQPLVIGRDEYEGEYGDEMFVQDARLVVGSLVYTGNFTPPTAPLTAITNTKLLLNMADPQAIDSAAQNNLTLYGTAKLSTGQAKFGDTSILFDGNSDFATFPHSESNDISGGNNWTVEFYWRFVDNDATQYQEIATKGVGFQLYANNGALAIALSASNNSTYFKNASNGTTLSDNTWYHIAVVKNGTGYKVYLDGTSESNLAVTSSSNVDTGTSPWCLGAYTSSSYYANGYMDEFRVSKFARYTGNFTAPTEPFPSQGQL